MLEVLKTIAGNEELIVIGGLTICGSLAIIFGSITSVCNRISTERSRREIAAYIAEGSMTPEQGERLMASKPNEKA